jgi:hypothetical protein
MTKRKKIEVIVHSVLFIFLISGCGALPAFLGGGSILGVEYAFINKTRRVYPIDKDGIRAYVVNVLEFFEFRVLLNWRKRASFYVIKAASNKYNIVITLQDVSPNATRVIVETKHKEYFLLKDEALENSILVELDKSFKK